ncbi:hypothetical protein, partial [Streptomyces lonarensis]|nr:hypothetical protein [Streptomyces lonarensis]
AAPTPHTTDTLANLLADTTGPDITDHPRYQEMLDTLGSLSAAFGPHQQGLETTSRQILGLPDDAPVGRAEIIEALEWAGRTRPAAADSGIDAATDRGADAVETALAPGSRDAVRRPASPPGGQLSRYARMLGSLTNSHSGLVSLSPPPAEVVADLHGAVLAAIGDRYGTLNDGQRMVAEAQLARTTGPREILRHRAAFRSGRGHPVTVTVGRTERTVYARLRYSDLRPSVQFGDPATRPDFAQGGKTEGKQTDARTTQQTANLRTAPLGYVLALPLEQGGVWLTDFALTLNATHNELTVDTTVTDNLSVYGELTSPHGQYPLDATAHWQIDHADGTSGGERASVEPVTLWLPRNRALTEGAAPGTPTADLSGLPLWSVESTGDAVALLPDLQRELPQLSDDRLSAGSRAELHSFLADEGLRATAHLQAGHGPGDRRGGVVSPVLADADGHPVGFLLLSAEIAPTGTPLTTDDGTTVGTGFGHGGSGDRKATLGSGGGFDFRGGVFATSGLPAEASGPTAQYGGGGGGRIGYGAKGTDSLTLASSATLVHGVSSKTNSLLTEATVRYTATFFGVQGAPTVRSFGSAPSAPGARRASDAGPRDSYRLLVAAVDADTSRGREPTPEERRTLPSHLETLRGIGLDTVPTRLDIDPESLDAAETALRDRGFLPPEAESSGWVTDRVLQGQQLENLRKLTRLRGRWGLAMSTPDAVDGGRSLWFEAGGRRARLQLDVRRDQGRSVVHQRRLPGVDVKGSRRSDVSVSTGRTIEHTATAGFAARGYLPVNGYWVPGQLDGSGSAHPKSGSDVKQSVQRVGDISHPEAGSDLFAVPVQYRLGLTVADETTYFTGEADPGRLDEETGPRRAAEDAYRNGVLDLVVDHTQTAPADAAATPGTDRTPTEATPPAQPRTDNAPAHSAPRVVDAEAAANHRNRLGRSEAAEGTRPAVTALPLGSTVLDFHATAAVLAAVRTALDRVSPPATETAAPPLPAPATETPGSRDEPDPAGPDAQTPAAGRNVADLVTDAVTAATSTAARHVRDMLDNSRGDDSLAAEVLHNGVRPSRLHANAPQIADGSFVLEALPLPVTKWNGLFSVEISALITRPRLEHSETAKSSLASTGATTLGDTSGSGRSGEVVFSLGALQRDMQDSTQNHPHGSYTYAARSTSSDAPSTTHAVTRTPADKSQHHTVKGDLSLLVTVVWGHTHLAAVALGEHGTVSVAVDVEDGVRFSASDAVLRPHARLFAAVAGLTQPAPGADLALLPPVWFTQEGSLDGAAATHLTLSDSSRDGHANRLRAGVESALRRIDSDIFTPGRPGYAVGARTAAGWITDRETLLTVLTRQGQRLSVQFVGQFDGRTRLVTISVGAALAATAEQRNALRGARAAGSLDQLLEVSPSDVKSEQARSSTHQLAFRWVQRFFSGDPSVDPDDRGGLTHRPGVGLSAYQNSGATVSQVVKGTDTTWLRGAQVGDFDGVPFTLTASVTHEPVTENWAASAVLGALETPTWLAARTGELIRSFWEATSLSLPFGGAAATRPAALPEPPGSRRPEDIEMTAGLGSPVVPALTPIDGGSTLEVAATATLRFVGSGEATADTGPQPAPVTTLDRDPAETDPDGPFARPYPLSRNTAFFHSFTGSEALATALHDIAPTWAGAALSQPGGNGDGSAVPRDALVSRLLTEAVLELGTGGQGPLGGKSGLVPGSFGGRPPQVRLSFHNVRPELEAPGTVIDRLEALSHTEASSSTRNRDWNFLAEIRAAMAPGLHMVLSRPVPSPGAPEVGRGTVESSSKLTVDRSGEATTDDAESGHLVDPSRVVRADVLVEITHDGRSRWVTGSGRVSLNPRDLLGLGSMDVGPHGRDIDLRAGVASGLGAVNGLPATWHQAVPTQLTASLADTVQQVTETEGTPRLWFAMADPAEIAPLVHLVSETARTAARDVELAVRAPSGTQLWHFDNTGAPTGPRSEALDALRDAARTHRRGLTDQMGAQQAAATQARLAADGRRAHAEARAELDRAGELLGRAQAHETDVRTRERNNVSAAERDVSLRAEDIGRRQITVEGLLAQQRANEQQLTAHSGARERLLAHSDGLRPNDPARQALQQQIAQEHQQIERLARAGAQLTDRLTTERDQLRRQEEAHRVATEARDAALIRQTEAVASAARDRAENERLHERQSARVAELGDSVTAAEQQRRHLRTEVEQAEQQRAESAARSLEEARSLLSGSAPAPVEVPDLIYAVLMDEHTSAGRPTAEQVPLLDLSSGPRTAPASGTPPREVPVPTVGPDVTHRFVVPTAGGGGQTLGAMPDGTLVLPDGRQLHPDGWVRYGIDFVHDPTSLVLDGSTGAIHRFLGVDRYERWWGEAPPDVRHRLVVTGEGLHLVRSGGGTRAVFLPFRRP